MSSCSVVIVAYHSGQNIFVVAGSVLGRVEGPLSGLLDVKAMMAGLGSPESRPPEEMRPLEGECRAEGEADAARQIPASRPVRVEYYFAAGCDDCEEVRRRIQPETMQRFGEAIAWESLDIAVPQNYLRLARLFKLAPTSCRCRR